MIRRYVRPRRKRPSRTLSASSCPDLPLAKGKSRGATKRAKDAEERRARDRCVERVWERDGGCCIACGKTLARYGETDDPFRIGHVAEITNRSQGGDPTDPRNCVLLCPICHLGGMHLQYPVDNHRGERLYIKPQTDHGAEGPVDCVWLPRETT